MLKSLRILSKTQGFLRIIFLVIFLFPYLHLNSKETITDLEARLEMARVLTNLKKYDEALQEYENILKVNPEFTAARVELAKVFFYQGKEDQALTELSKIPSNQINDETQILVADIYRNKKKYADAEKIYSDYLKKNPLNDAIRLKLAELLSWQKRYEDSIKEYKMILSHRPDDVQVRRKYAQVLTWMGKHEEAIEEWKKTLQ